MRTKYLLISLCCILFAACKEEIDMSNRYVFSQHTIASYLEAHEDYSEYYNLLQQVNISQISESTVGQLVSARGHYTCFAPTNEAIHNYLEELVEKEIIAAPSWDSFTDQHILDSIRAVIVKNSIIDGGDELVYETANFPNENGEFELANMKDRKLSVHYGYGTHAIFINSTCLIDDQNRNISCINGVIHQMHNVIAPSEINMGELLGECAEGLHSDYQVMSKLVIACGLQKTLGKTRDEEYEVAYLRGHVRDYEANGLASTVDGKCYVPEHRKFGYTLFAEPDLFWENLFHKKAADITVEEVKAWVKDKGFYPEATTGSDYTNENNVLNQFVTYHLLPMRIPVNKLVMHNNEAGYRLETSTLYSVPVMEHYTTMGKPRLLKIYQSAETSMLTPDGQSGIFLNRFPVLDNSRHGTYHEVSCNDAKSGVLIYDKSPKVEEFNTQNGMIYPIGGVLAYSEDVRNSMMASRIRFDVMSFFPEVMNNDIRQSSIGSAKTQCVAFPQDNVYKYLDNVTINPETLTFCYFCAYGWHWNNLYGDELKGIGYYDYTFKLPPVPKYGTYEIRYKVLANADRGICQIYFGSNPKSLPIAGIPMDLANGGIYRYLRSGEVPSIVGWEEDIDDDDYNSDIDKRMRMNGFMKGPAYYWDGSISSRQQHWNVRRIIVRETMDPNKQYYLRFKSCIDPTTPKEFYMDYIEYCPKEIYDNPITPEDIW